MMEITREIYEECQRHFKEMWKWLSVNPINGKKSWFEKVDIPSDDNLIAKITLEESSRCYACFVARNAADSDDDMEYCKCCPIRKYLIDPEKTKCCKPKEPYYLYFNSRCDFSWNKMFVSRAVDVISKLTWEDYDEYIRKIKEDTIDFHVHDNTSVIFANELYRGIE